MFNANSPEECLERAEMHEQLAAATDDVLARKMHQAMAAEYRRRATEDGLIRRSRRRPAPIRSSRSASIFGEVTEAEQTSAAT